ncbi:MAG TPA: hypothetical protein PKA27_05795 [Fimbriimonadaceae bacterium]|nr:hypothetical protein [Fimbriimonadaceae bacterium]
MNVRFVTVGVVLSLAQFGLCQLNHVGSTVRSKVRLKANTLYRVLGNGPEGSQPIVAGPIRITADSQLIRGTYIELEETTLEPKPGVEPIKVEHSLYTISLYPATMWTVAGQLFDSSNNSVTGGTTTISGATIAANALISNPGRSGTAFEVGGFFFKPYRESDGDFYQISLGGMFTPNLGLQVGYYNSTKVDLRAVSYHMLVRLASGMVQPLGGKEWGITLGLGGFFNYAPDSGSRVVRRTHNVSAFVSGNYAFTDRLSLVGTIWFLRDRNVDVTRLAAGISFKF